MANSDLGHKLTDKELAKLERRIEKLYREAGKELQATIDAYFEQFQKRDEEMKALIGTVQNGKEWAEADYKQWRLNQIGRGERYQTMRDKVAHRATEANAVAVSYTNDATPGIYSLNRNYSAYTIEQVAGNVGFDLWDEQTVKRLMVEQPELMPYYPPKRALKRGIDLAYGKKQITASVTSSILQGKSIKNMADDLQKRITTMSRGSAIRTARTAVTGAQNAGRMDSYAAAEKMGIKLKKEWLATLDARTRHSHAMLDGEQVAQDKKFSNGCRFPGDPQGPPWEIYNCRCTLIAAVEGVDTSSAQRRAKNADTGQTEVISNMTYAEWAGWKKAEAKKGNKTFNTVKEAEAWIHDQGIDFVMLNGADAKTASTIANAVNTLPPGITPKAITDLTSFKKGFGGKLQRKDAQIYGVTLDNLWGINFGDGMRDYDGGVMVGFNFRNYKNATAIAKSKEDTNKRYMEKTGNMWHFNLSGEATYYHEIGHAYAELKRELPTGFHEAVQKWYKESQCDILQKDSEAWAEAWAAYHLGDSRLPDYIAEFIKGVY
jgi:SPP1 gp7 family putative phage head morphogenesis protein